MNKVITLLLCLLLSFSAMAKKKKRTLCETRIDDMVKETKVANRHGGGKNAAHANAKKRDAAAKKYQELKTEYERLNGLQNKSPSDKKLRDKVKKQMQAAKKEMDFVGENHSMKAKGK